MNSLLYRVNFSRELVQLVRFLPASSGLRRNVLGLPRAILATPCAALGSYSVQAGDLHSFRSHARRRYQALEAVPRIGSCATITAVLDVHATYGPKLKPADLAACWNHVGKLVSSQHERRWLKRNQELLDPLLDQTKRGLGQLSARHLANTVHGIAKIAAVTEWDPGPGTWKKLEERILNSIDNFNSHDYASTVWAFAKAGPAATGFYDAIADKAAPRLHEFESQTITNIAWGFATAKHAAPTLFDAVASAALPNLHKYTSQNISNLAWAFATAGHSAPALFDAIEEITVPQLHEFGPQAISITVWAFSTAEHQAPALFDAIAKIAPSQLSDFNPQNIANTTWAFATARHAAPALFDLIAKITAPLLFKFKPAELVSTIHSFASARHRAPALFDAAINAAVPRLHEFNSQALSNVAWAYAKAGHEAPLLYENIARIAIPQLHIFDPQAISITSWAFATANQPAPALFRGFAEAAMPQLHNFNPQALSNTAWAYAMMNHEETDLFESITRNSAQRLLEVEPQHLTNMAWACAVFDFQSEDLFGGYSPFQSLCAARSATFSHQGLCQLHQWQLWRKEHNVYNELPIGLQQRCHKAFTENKSHSSNFQKEVVNVLTSLEGVSDVQEEVQVASGYSVDATVTFRGHTIGIEVDGPCHFVGNTYAPNGPTRLKRRQLLKLDDLPLLPIPYWEWRHKSDDELKTYLRQKLDSTLLVN